MGIKVRKGGVWVEVSSGGGSGGSSDPVGTIVAWAGSVASIPTSEYQLCDGGAASTSALQAITGSNVPDLRDRFIVGANNISGTGTYPGVGVGSTGGAATHTLTVAEIPSHNHGTNPNNSALMSVGNGPYSIPQYGGSNNTGGGQAHNNLPPYYALCYIIKHTATSGGGGGGTGTLTDVDVKQYSDSNTPRTEYGCSNPIEVTVSAGIATIGIGSTSNAYGKKYIQTTEPTTDVCDGDIWYDTTPGSGSSGGFVTGMIMMFSGTTAPTGWVLCNGSNGTPDLTDRFIVGAGNNYAVDATGGSANAVLIAHNHTISPTTVLSSANGGPTILQGTSSGTALNYGTSTGSDIVGQTNTGADSTTQTGTNANLPPYYALAFIMKT